MVSFGKIPMLPLRFVMRVFHLFSLIISLVFIPLMHAQEKPSDADIKAALVYNFTQHFDWSEFARNDSFLIGIFGVDSVMQKSLKQIEKREIKNRTVKVISFPQLHEIRKTDILYVNHSRNYEIDKIYRLIKNTQTLLITDRCADKQVVMINFIHDNNNKVSFEINKKNIDDELISMSSKILLLGGTEIDIRELYLQTEKVLELEKTRVIQVESQLKSKEKELSALNFKIGALQSQINDKNEVIQEQQTNINLQKDLLLAFHDSLLVIAAKTQSQSVLLDSLNSSLLTGNKEKELLDKQLYRRNQEVDSANQKLGILYSNIADQEKVLSQQVREIKYLRRSRQIIFTALVLFFLLIASIFRSYRTIRKKNRKIEKQSSLLMVQKDSLQHANEELRVQKETLQETLHTLQKTQDQLVESQKMASLGQLSAGIAHEINNPINFISSSIEGLKVIIHDFMSIVHKYDEVNSSNMNEKLAEIEQLKKELDFQEILSGFTLLTNNIKSGADRTKEIVNSMRVFYRSGDTITSKVSLNKLLASTVVLIKNQIKNRISIIENYGEIPKIDCQPGMLNQVFLNIIENAIHAIKDKGTITITTRQIEHAEQKYVRVDIADSGKGIPHEISKKIFDPFFTTKDVGKGTGLGMYLAYNIVHNHRGEIEFESEVNKGTTFHLTFPTRLV